MFGLDAFQSLVQGRKKGLSGIGFLPALVQNDIGTTRQGFATKAFKRLEPHDHSLSQSRRLEMLKILGEMPRELIPLPDHAVIRHCNDMK